MNNYINAKVITNQKKIKANMAIAPTATTERAGLIRIATQEEALAGIDNSIAITPLTLKLAGNQDYAHSLEMNLDEDYILTIKLKNSNGEILSTQTVDFPSEYAIVSVDYDPTTKELIFTLENGTVFKTAITGLQAEITNDNKLNSDLVDDTNNINRFVTSSQKSFLNNITATANEINILDGATIDVAELNSLNNITDNVQSQLNNKVNNSRKINNNPLTSDINLGLNIESDTDGDLIINIQ